MADKPNEIPPDAVDPSKEKTFAELAAERQASQFEQTAAMQDQLAATATDPATKAGHEAEAKKQRQYAADARANLAATQAVLADPDASKAAGKPSPPEVPTPSWPTLLDAGAEEKKPAEPEPPASKPPEATATAPGKPGKTPEAAQPGGKPGKAQQAPTPGKAASKAFDPFEAAKTQRAKEIERDQTKAAYDKLYPKMPQTVGEAFNGMFDAVASPDLKRAVHMFGKVYEFGEAVGNWLRSDEPGSETTPEGQDQASSPGTVPQGASPQLPESTPIAALAPTEQPATPSPKVETNPASSTPAKKAHELPEATPVAALAPAEQPASRKRSPKEEEHEHRRQHAQAKAKEYRAQAAKESDDQKRTYQEQMAEHWEKEEQARAIKLEKIAKRHDLPESTIEALANQPDDEATPPAGTPEPTKDHELPEGASVGFDASEQKPGQLPELTPIGGPASNEGPSGGSRLPLVSGSAMPAGSSESSGGKHTRMPGMGSEGFGSKGQGDGDGIDEQGRSMQALSDKVDTLTKAIEALTKVMEKETTPGADAGTPTKFDNGKSESKAKPEKKTSIDPALIRQGTSVIARTISMFGS